jgi:hypothetical protein
MDNLAFTYSARGRHADARAMQERALELSRRELPEDHPDIGERHARCDTVHEHVFFQVLSVCLW